MLRISPDDFKEAQGVLPNNKRISPVGWWTQRSTASVGRLAVNALKVNNMKPAAAGGERVWSVFGSTWSPLRATMLVGRVGLLCFIKYNSRIVADLMPGAAVGSSNGMYSWEEFYEWLDTMPGLQLDASGHVVPDEEGAPAAGGGVEAGDFEKENDDDEMDG